MTSHRLTAEDVTAIIEEKNSLVRENARLLSLIVELESRMAEYRKAAEWPENLKDWMKKFDKGDL